MSERPHRAHTWAPRGETPVLQYHFHWKTLSAIAGVTIWRFYFQLYAGTIRKEEVVSFLKHLCRHVRGRLLIVWDNLNQHRSRYVKEYVAAQRGAIELEYLPACAPELNPVEYIWGYWKKHELPNLCAKDLVALGASGRAALRRMRRRPALAASFWQQALLSLYSAMLNNYATRDLASRDSRS